MKKSEKLNKKAAKAIIENIYEKNFSTLSGCVRSFSDDMKACDAEGLKGIATLVGVSVATVRKVSVFCKDKKAIYAACKAMLPTIDGQIIEYKPIKRLYLTKDKADKSFDKTEELKESFVLGKAYKAYGAKDVIDLNPAEPAIIKRVSATCKSEFAPFLVKRFRINKIMKAVIDYITLCEKNNLPLK